ncbi:MAG: hypothetical protein E6J14_02345 [Chloroflexi bacterium]|nr:MAG: hypothetical protein E6J14_02345 [Chloroflexota bacterium]
MTLDRDRQFTVMLAITVVLTLVFAGLVVADLTHTHQSVQTSASGGAAVNPGGTAAPAGPQATAAPGANGTVAGRSATSAAPGAKAGVSVRAGGGAAVADTGHGNGQILLGSIVTTSGPGRSIPMAHAILSWVRSINQAGGINGNRINLDMRDDGGNPDTGAGEYRQFAEGEKVFAVLGECAPVTDSNQVTYVNQTHLILVGECQSSPPAYQSPYIFVTGPTPFQNGQLGAKLMLTTQNWPRSGGKVAEICLDEAAVQSTCDGVHNYYGSGALYGGAPIMESIAANDYADVIAKLRSAGIDHVHLVIDPGSLQRYLYAAQQQQFFVQVMNNLVTDDGVAANPQWAQAANNMFQGTPWTPLNHTDTPGMQRLAHTVQTYYPDDRIDLYSQTGWANCLLMEHALQLMGPNISKQSLLDTLYSIHNWDTGLGPVENYSPQNHTGQVENWLMQLHNSGSSNWHLDEVHGQIGL